MNRSSLESLATPTQVQAPALLCGTENTYMYILHTLYVYRSLQQSQDTHTEY